MIIIITPIEVGTIRHALVNFPLQISGIAVQRIRQRKVLLLLGVDTKASNQS